MIIFKYLTVALSATFGFPLLLNSMTELKNGNIPVFVGMVLMAYAYFSGIILIL